MSTEQHKPGPAEIRLPLHEDVSFEARDVHVSIILKFLAYMGVAIILSFFLSLGIYHGLLRYWNSEYTPPPPSRAGAGSMMPPEPRMQGMPGHFVDPQQDLRNKVKADSEANNQLSWIDEKAGVAQIPVSDAMKLIVEKGLPAVTAPPAEKKAESK
ncbi:MAG TPA: hypothetical protein VGI13_07640 [Candidatus Acidoferrum sp.]|jgi:hypothetical protein